MVISPHLDDAVLSCGQFLAGRPDAVVVTIFAGLPERHRALTTYDRDCGFRSAGQAVGARRLEDRAALGVLDAMPVALHHLDCQYREIEPADEPDPMDIAAGLCEIFDRLDGCSLVMGPLGLAHPDHLIAADAFALFLSMRPVEAWLYEDQPSRVLWPEQVPARLDRWRDRGWRPELGFVGTGPLEAKLSAIECYESQLASLRLACGGNLYPVLVPERHHRLWRAQP